MSDLPKNWKRVSLGEVASITSGIGFPLKFQGIKSGDLPFFKVGDISRSYLYNRGFLSNAEHYISYETTKKLRGKPIETGSTVFAKIGEALKLNRRAFVQSSCLVDNNVMAVKAHNSELDRYVYYFLMASDLTEFSRATTVPSLRKGDVESLAFPLPPLDEQKRIADKLDSLLARVEQCQTRLDRLPHLLKAFRQSVLAAATSGRLTEDWREENSVIGDWRLVKLSDVATSRLGKMLDAAKNRGELRPYLRNINVRWFDFDLNDIQQLRISDDEAKTLTVRKGDVLVCEGGEPGRCAVWRGENDAFLFQKALHRVRVGEKLTPEWVSYSLKTAADSGTLADYFTGTTIKHFTGISLSQFELYLPTIAEQHEIVRRVERLFAFAERLETRWRAAQGQLSALTPSLLAKAFRGELVGQEEA